MNFLLMLAIVILFPVAVYVTARVITAAYYQSKRQYERMTSNGTQKP